MATEPLIRRPLTRDLLVLLLVIILCNGFTAWYVTREHTIYSWDRAFFHGKFQTLGATLTSDPLQAVKDVVASVNRDEYNDLSIAPLMPFYLLFGGSRLSFISALVNTYLIPSFVLLILLSRRIAPATSQDRPWLEVFLLAITLTSLTLWAPTLRGYVAAGGLALLLAALLLYFSRPLEQWDLARLAGLALLLALAALFRRWFILGIVPFFVAALVSRSLGLWLEKNRFHRGHVRLIARILLLGGLFTLLMLLFNHEMILVRLEKDYTALFASYSRSHLAHLIEIGSSFGWAFLLLALAAPFLAWNDPRTRETSLFLILTLILSYLLFTAVQKFMALHQQVLLIPYVLLLDYTAIFALDRRIRSTRVKAGTAVATGLASLALFLLCTAPGAAGKGIAGKLVNLTYPPLQRNDLAELDRLAGRLRDIRESTPGAAFYVLASSGTLNDDVLRRAMRRRGLDRLAEAVLPVHHIDSRDGFLFWLFRATHVLVAMPVQIHLDPESQRVIEIPARHLLDGTGLGRDYHQMDGEFVLDGGVRVAIFEQARHPDVGQIGLLLKEFSRYYSTWDAENGLFQRLRCACSGEFPGEKWGSVRFRDDHSIFLHPGETPTRVTFNLGRSLRNLKIMAAFDPLGEACLNLEDPGVVEFTVRADGREIHRSIQVHGHPDEIDLDVAGVDELTFEVDSHGPTTCDWFAVKILEGEEGTGNAGSDVAEKPGKVAQ